MVVDQVDVAADHVVTIGDVLLHDFDAVEDITRRMYQSRLDQAIWNVFVFEGRLFVLDQSLGVYHTFSLLPEAIEHFLSLIVFYF